MSVVPRGEYLPDELVGCHRSGQRVSHRWFYGAGQRSRCACGSWGLGESGAALLRVAAVGADGSEVVALCHELEEDVPCGE